MTTTTTYTVTHKDGEVIARGLSAYDAMTEVMGYDSYRWEVRAEETEGDETRFALYTSSQSAASYGGYKMVPTVIAVWAKSEAEALSIIADEVIRQCGGWRKSPDVYTDAEYDAILAQAEEDE